jgi:hypothetical protein
MVQGRAGIADLADGADGGVDQLALPRFLDEVQFGQVSGLSATRPAPGENLKYEL